MRSHFDRSSFKPPAIADADAAATGSRYPASVLLDKRAYFADRDNTTTAQARTSSGDTVKVTFCLADPPAVSHFCVHSPDVDYGYVASEPEVIYSAKNLVLLRFHLPNDYEGVHFVYKAGDPEKPPSLKLIPHSSSAIRLVAVVPCDGDDGEFLLADLSRNTHADYSLKTFSSRTREWSTRILLVDTSPVDVKPGDLPATLDKVIPLGAGAVGWVDLSRGILACDVDALHDDDHHPVLRFIPLPKPKSIRDHGMVEIRDVTCTTNGFIEFAEVEPLSTFVIGTHYKTVTAWRTTRDLDAAASDTILDTDLLLRDEVRAESVPSIVPDGWRLRTYHRHVSSSDSWQRGRSVHADDVSPVDNTRHFALLPELWDSGVTGVRNLRLRNLRTTPYPTLSTRGDGVVYLVSTLELDGNAWIIGVDVGKKTVESLQPYSSHRARTSQLALIHCAFSEYLNGTPDNASVSEINGAQSCVHNVQQHYSMWPPNWRHPYPGYPANVHPTNGAGGGQYGGPSAATTAPTTTGQRQWSPAY